MIAADAAGQSVTLSGSGFTNAGVLKAQGGGTLNLAGTFDTGQLGVLENSGGTLALSGTLNNSGTTLGLDATTGTMMLNGGALNGGTVSSSAGGGLAVAAFSTGLLNGVTLDTDMSVNGRSTLTVQNGLTLANGH